MNEYTETYSKTANDSDHAKHVLSEVRQTYLPSSGWKIGVAKITTLPSGKIELEIPLRKSADNGLYEETFYRVLPDVDTAMHNADSVRKHYSGNGWTSEEPVYTKLPNGEIVVQIALAKNLTLGQEQVR